MPSSARVPLLLAVWFSAKVTLPALVSAQGQPALVVVVRPGASVACRLVLGGGLVSFPTRRSSDLSRGDREGGSAGGAVAVGGGDGHGVDAVTQVGGLRPAPGVVGVVRKRARLNARHRRTFYAVVRPSATVAGRLVLGEGHVAGAGQRSRAARSRRRSPTRCFCCLPSGSRRRSSFFPYTTLFRSQSG